MEKIFTDSFLDRIEDLICQNVEECQNVDCDKCMKDFAEQFKKHVNKFY